jgi:hypothetical protein
MATERTYTSYIQRGGEIVFKQPYQLGDAELWGFLLRGTEENIQRLCDKYLNEPRLGPGQKIADLDFRYRTDTNLIYLCVDSIGDIDPSGNTKISMSEPAELIFWILTRFERRNEKGIFEFERFVWFVPYIFVGGSVPAIAAGREVYGMPKEEAWFTLSPSKKHLTMDTLVYGNGYPKSERARLVEIQEMNTPYNVWDWINLTQVLVKEVIEENGKPIGNLARVVSQIVQDLLNMSIRQVSLKQFRDVKYGMQACYQAIIESPFSVSKGTPVLRLLDKDYLVTIKSYESHPIISDLGIKGELTNEDFGVTTITQKPIIGAHINFDFVLGRGEVIWRSKIDYEEIDLDKKKENAEQHRNSNKHPLCKLFDLFGK